MARQIDTVVGAGARSDPPVGAYLASPHLAGGLVELVQFIFRHEAVPDGMAVEESIMLWKGKGGTGGLAQHRAVCLGGVWGAGSKHYVGEAQC